MATVIVSPDAEADLDEIAFRISLDNVPAARRWMREMKRTFDTLAQFPGIGPRRDELLADSRSFPVGNYLIFYRPATGGIHVLRVIDGRRNLPEVFDAPAS